MRFTEQHNALRNTVARFVQDELNPHVEAWEAAGELPSHEIMKKAGDLGLLGIDKPESYGGLGLDFSYQAVFSEELGGADHGSSPLLLGVHTMMSTPALARYGSDELREEFLAPAIAGDSVSSIAVSEPHAGSDVAAIKTTAKKDGDDYVINGTKMWITNSTQADFFCLLANTGEGPIHKNKSLIIVPSDTPGVSVAPKLDKLGLRASDTAQVFFEDVRVPQRNRIGEEGMGFVYQMRQFQEERMYCALVLLKNMDNCIQKTIEYTRERTAFGKPLLDNQVIQFRLAELQTEVEAVRALTYAAVEQHVAGEDMTMKASMVKLKAGRLAVEVANSCLQYWGGMGFMWDNYCARALRDNRVSCIGGGSDETMLSIIAKHMGTLHQDRAA
ncbi:MAG: acyl-CoA dehydrogenase family protein [Halieaceae bacterium]|nr:acyl-CoA dehydrogenase family protein [Halieaceae bacterium]